MQVRSAEERLMQEALAIINGPRRSAYGKPERNFSRIALLWTAYLRADETLEASNPIGPIQVCHMLDLVKLARLIETPNHEDSLRDRFGYNGCNVDLVLNAPHDDKVWIGWPPTLDDGETAQQAAE